MKLEINSNYKPIIVAIIQTGPQEKSLHIVEHPADTPAFRALARMESANNPSKKGSLGERSIYQISEAQWKEFSNLTWCPANWRNLDKATYVANNIWCSNYNRFITGTGGTAPRPHESYIMWHTGFSFFKSLNFDIRRVPFPATELATQFFELTYYYANIN